MKYHILSENFIDINSLLFYFLHLTFEIKSVCQILLTDDISDESLPGRVTLSLPVAIRESTAVSFSRPFPISGGLDCLGLKKATIPPI